MSFRLSGFSEVHTLIWLFVLGLSWCIGSLFKKKKNLPFIYLRNQVGYPTEFFTFRSWLIGWGLTHNPLPNVASHQAWNIWSFISEVKISGFRRCQPDFIIAFLVFFVFCFNLWLCWVFVAARGLSLAAASGGYSLLRCAGFSLWRLLFLQSTDSRCRGFSSCGMWAQ